MQFKVWIALNYMQFKYLNICFSLLAIELIIIKMCVCFFIPVARALVALIIHPENPAFFCCCSVLDAFNFAQMNISLSILRWLFQYCDRFELFVCILSD